MKNDNKKTLVLRLCLAFAAAFLIMSDKENCPGEFAEGITDLRPGIEAYTDLWHLCFWHEGLEAGQSSSHSDAGRNIDFGHFHGTFRLEPVLARIEGPGVVYRIWSAGPSGRIKFYADGKPALKCPFEDYLDGRCLSETIFAVGRKANYTPIPFNQSLIITAPWVRLHEAYYQVSYMSFKSGAPLRTVTGHGAEDRPEVLEQAMRFWRTNGEEPGRDPGGIDGSTEIAFTLGPGESDSVTDNESTGMFTSMKMYDPVDPLNPLSGLRLQMYWDGNQEPAVDSPVDAFFGNRFDARRISEHAREKGVIGYQSIAVSATDKGYSCRWPMPFEGGVKLKLTNEGDTVYRVRVELDYRGILGELPDNTMRFHAIYREREYPDLLEKDKVRGVFFKAPQEENYVALWREGRGYYVGLFLYVVAAVPDWWGEGDEMIWVDGEAEASIRGTGTEDEFNWSYGFKEYRSPISGALLARRIRTRGPSRLPAYNALYRWRIGDFVPFEKSIKVSFERLGSTHRFLRRYPGSLVNVSIHRGDDYSSVAFWYELPQ